MENQNTLMGELISVLKESLRKQAFSVVLLICCCGALWIIRKEDRAEMKLEISDLNTRLNHCAAARESQAVEIATLKVSVSLLSARR